MALDNDSYARARSIVSSINSRFPRERGDDGAIARGRGNGGGTAGYQSIALRIPNAYREKPEEFLQLVRHMRVDSSVPEEFARQYVEDLKQFPALADDLHWCLQAIGKSTLPFVRSMYDYPELAPRMSALQAGARLGDAPAAPPLIELAKKSTPSIRLEAMLLLTEMPSNPAINLALRDIVNDKNLEIRVAAYEALRKRGDAIIVQVPIGDNPEQPKFTLDLLPSPDPLIYITQQGEPRVVLFGGVDPMWHPGTEYRGIKISKPVLATCWNDRFMLSAAGPNDVLRVFYRNQHTGTSIQANAPEGVAKLVEFLAHTQTPEDPKPGLGMSYSQVVGVLYELCPKASQSSDKLPALAATFATEEDRLRAEIFEAAQTNALADRPENEEEALKQANTLFRPTAAMPLPSADGTVSGDGLTSKVVPLKKPTTK